MAAATIMVVEDDPDLREAVEEVLRAQGHDVFGAANGEQALAMLAVVRPDVILLDFAMPIMDGRGFLARRRTRPGLAAIPVVVMSGLAIATSDVAGDDVTVLAKPWSVAKLLDSLAPYLPV